MCGRYTLYAGEDYDEITDIVSAVEQALRAGGVLPPAGEIYPTNLAPVLVPSVGKATPELLGWGFPNVHSKGVLINARAETVRQKPFFRSSFYNARCVIPSAGFFEWDKSRLKYRFSLPDTGVLYMAGLFREFDGENRFLILTTAANSSVADIHDRMPVVLPKARIDDWLFYTDRAEALLASVPPLLIKKAV